ncbi:ATPase, partial [Escherichia coli]|nr:ATPase [Escherichia coli]
PAEIKQLEKIYTSLGLDPSSVSSNIHQHSVTETALVSSVPANQSTAGFTLDDNVLECHESGTDDVRKLLNSIFTEEEPEQPESAPASLTGEGGLDS